MKMIDGFPLLKGENGRRIVKSLYGWNRIAAETRRTMEDLILMSQLNEENING